MSTAICKCAPGMLNTGLPACSPTPKVIKKIVFVNLVANDGTLNSIDPSTTLNNAWIVALINNSDTSKRFFPTPELKNVDTPKTDPTFQTYDDDSKYFVKEGVRSFTGIFPDCPPAYKAKLESIRCNSGMGFYWIDIQGNFIGLNNGTTDGKLYPIPMNVQSVIGKVVMANDKSVTEVQFSYDIPAYVNDANLWMISGSAFPDFSPLQIAGLLDVNVTLVSVTDTVLTVKLSTPSPAADLPIAIQGLVTANFISSNDAATSKIYNVTDSANDTVVAAEISAGQYTLTCSSISAKTLILFAKLAGYDFTALKSLVIVTP